MRRAIPKRLIVFLLFLLPVNPLRAGPMATWTSSWQVTFFPPTSGSASQAATNFGKSATMNGEMLDLGMPGEMLPDTSAFARVILGVAKPTSASESVIFSRTFRLEDSPNGWDVSLPDEELAELIVRFADGLQPDAMAERLRESLTPRS